MARDSHLRALRVGAAAALTIGALLLGAAYPAAATSHTTVVRAALPPGKINHIIVIEFENEGYQTTFGPGLLPHVNTSGKPDSLPHLKPPDEDSG